ALWFTIAGIAGLSLSLYVRRGRSPGAPGAPGAPGDTASPVAGLLSPSPEPPAPHRESARHPRVISQRFTLKLARIIPETPDTRTLRFLVMDGAALVCRAGQFLTFDWSIDGRKIPRCYSISSSPARGFVDITVKRVEGGLVSSYLHDRAAVGQV